jgi:hypothetical protein
VFNDPLHDAQVVAHLHERNEEDNRGEGVNEEPVFTNGLFVKEELSASKSLVKEVASKLSDPFENFETSVALEDEQSDSLLQEETDNDGRPRSPVKSHLLLWRFLLVTHHGTNLRFFDVAQKQNWNTASPRTEIARSP